MIMKNIVLFLFFCFALSCTDQEGTMPQQQVKENSLGRVKSGVVCEGKPWNNNVYGVGTNNPYQTDMTTHLYSLPGTVGMDVQSYVIDVTFTNNGSIPLKLYVNGSSQGTITQNGGTKTYQFSATCN